MDNLPPAPQQPNILLVVVDDMGYTDLGSFGGEIETPNLDALAYNGIRFTNFQTAPTCSPTRAMLLTGVDNHKAGLGNMHEELSPNQKGRPGYEGYLNDRVVTVASLLRDAGYRTYMAGKWHLGFSDETSPAARGFDRSFAMLSGGASHFGDMKPAYAPTPDAKAPYRENGRKLDKLPESFGYSTRFYADRIIENIEESRASGQPFFAYLAYTAPHWPIQAPDDMLDKYKGRYDAGYDVIHAQRLEKQKALGLLPESVQPTPHSGTTFAWNQLSDEERKVEVRQMEIYAAMIDEVDINTGRLVSYLKASGLFENTLIIFMSDNGAEGHNMDSTWPADKFPKIRKVIDETHNFSYENMGKPSSYVFLGEGWARASSPAIKYYKGMTSEGGTRVSAFVYYPKVFSSGTIEKKLVSVKDIAPTLLEMAGIKPPGTQYKGRQVESMSGISMASLFRSGMLPKLAENRVLGIELMGKRAIRKGDWKLVHMLAPYGNGDWQLYNLKQDLAETHDLASKNPNKLNELKVLWDQYSKENKVILPDWVSGY
jgi:arylsulfatase